jgi:hypothetical protein
VKVSFERHEDEEDNFLQKVDYVEADATVRLIQIWSDSSNFWFRCPTPDRTGTLADVFWPEFTGAGFLFPVLVRDALFILGVGLACVGVHETAQVDQSGAAQARLCRVGRDRRDEVLFAG